MGFKFHICFFVVVIITFLLSIYDIIIISDYYANPPRKSNGTRENTGGDDPSHVETGGDVDYIESKNYKTFIIICICVLVLSSIIICLDIISVICIIIFQDKNDKPYIILFVCTLITHLRGV